MPLEKRCFALITYSQMWALALFCAFALIVNRQNGSTKVQNRKSYKELKERKAQKILGLGNRSSAHSLFHSKIKITQIKEQP